MRKVTKRTFDVVTASLLLVVLSPVFAFVALLVRIKLGSPVLFRQERPGRDGAPFTVVKFRTMREGAAPDAERLTKLGRGLRRTSLDELPELTNVVRGDMSLVGPRPLLMEYLPLYSPAQRRRHDVRPGITGWAQVKGRNALRWDDKLALDVWYVDHQSMVLDLKIIGLTVATVFTGRGVAAPGDADHAAVRGPSGERRSAGRSRVSRRVLVVGGSDQGRQVIDAVEAGGEHVVVGVLDAALPVGSDVSGHPVLGSDDDLTGAAEMAHADGFVVAIGDNHRRQTVFEHARTACPDLAPIAAIHPAALVARDARLGPGSILMAGAVVSNGCTIGAGALLGTNSSIDHDCVAGEHVSLAPGAATGGNVRIGDCTAIGVGAAIVHAVTIGAHSVIGAGAVVIGDLPDHVVAYGTPARVARDAGRGRAVPLRACVDDRIDEHGDH